MASTFPTTLDAFNTALADATAQGPNTHKNHHNDLAEAVNKVEASLITGVAMGGGDNQQIYSTQGGDLGSLVTLRKGTAASPDTGLKPALRVTRLEQVTTGIVGDGCEQLPAIAGISAGTVTTAGQPVGVFGGAKNISTVASPLGADDACGLYGVGLIGGSGTGTGLGGFLNGRRETATGRATGVEIVCDNQTVTAGTYITTGYNNTTGIWLTAVGLADAGVGLCIGNPAGFQFDVGIAFNAQVNGGKTGGAKTASIRDDGNATTSIAINGTHTAALAIASGAGKVFIGGTAEKIAASSLEIQLGAASKQGAFWMGTTDAAFTYSAYIRNSLGIGEIGVAGATGSIITGTVGGDLVVHNQTTAKSVHLGGNTASVIEVDQANTLGFFQTAPRARPTGWGVPTGTPTRTTFVTSTVTLPQLAERVMALIEDLHQTAGYGLLGT